MNQTIDLKIDPGSASAELITDLFISLNNLYRAVGGERIDVDVQNSRDVTLQLTGSPIATGRFVNALRACLASSQELEDLLKESETP